MRKILLVAVVISLFVFPAAAGANRMAPLWHCDAVTVAQATPGWNVTATGAGAYWRIKAVGGSTVAGPQQSPVFRNLALDSGSQYQAQAADGASGPWSNDPGCIFTVAPLGVIVTDFRASCHQTTVMLEWSVSSHLSVTWFVIAKDGAEVLTVQADCPGCTNGSSYMRYLTLDDPTGIYTLIAYNGDAISDVSEYWLGACQVPTAVRISRFSAK